MSIKTAPTPSRCKGCQPMYFLHDTRLLFSLSLRLVDQISSQSEAYIYNINGDHSAKIEKKSSCYKSQDKIAWFLRQDCIVSKYNSPHPMMGWGLSLPDLTTSGGCSYGTQQGGEHGYQHLHDGLPILQHRCFLLSAFGSTLINPPRCRCRRRCCHHRCRQSRA